MGTPESKALRHAFFAERAASRVADLPDSTPTRAIERVAVIGAGTMGRGIATAFADAGLPVVLVDADAKALERAVDALRSGGKKLKPEDIERRVRLVTTTSAIDDAASADLIVEAVFEDMTVKRDVFAKLDRIAKPGAILATNTSTLDVDKLADATSRPADVLGLHFFSPANVMRLLEVVRGARTSAETLATAMALAKRIGKTAVVSRVCDGINGNRMVEQYLRQAMFVVEEGATPAAVDAALERFGMAMGPFRMSDLAGLDIGWKIRQRRYVERPQVPWSRLGDRLCEQGRFGQKTGAGWYRYAPGKRDALPDPAVDAIVEKYRHERCIAPRRIPDDEIVDRCILALVAEGARVLDDGIAQRASDIDVVYLTGYGFPRHRGGPMFYADTRGLYDVARRMRAFAARGEADRAFWTPSPRLEQMANEGRTFNP
jgi:3-hydroxyacyl-CoA dehydrogenase